MRVNLPGLYADKLPSGRLRWIVRMQGDPRRKVTVPPPDDPSFAAAYDAARRGVKLERMPETVVPRSVEWLVRQYLSECARRVQTGRMAATTLRQRRAFYDRLIARHGGKAMDMPRTALVQMRDEMGATPGAADNFVKAVGALYRWGVEVGHVKTNPATKVGRINTGTGAVPWSVADLHQYRAAHPQGTMAHLALTLLVFTACRVSDVYRLGRRHESVTDGQTWLTWQPAKAGSKPVSLPVLPPLWAATRAQSVIGPTYLLTQHGQPFASAAAFGNRFRKWTADAGLEGRSPHGVRKAVATLLAEHGLSQHHIMAFLGHTQAKTSEIYTSSARRNVLAGEAIRALAGMEW